MSPGLSARQEECLRLTAFLTDKEIATRLGLSEATVKKHVHEACRRLGVNRRKAALALLERKVPEATKDPIGLSDTPVSSPLNVREADDGFSKHTPLPQWTWEDLEAALDGFSTLGENDPVRAHLMRGLTADAERSSPRELLQQVLSAGWVMAQVGAQNPASDIAPPRNWGVRVLIIVVMVVLAAVMMRAIADSIVAYQKQVRVIDETVMQGAARDPA